MEKIRKAVEKFKKENGNDKFNEKELLMYIIQRLDNLPCEKHIDIIYRIRNDVEVNKAHFKMWMWVTPIIITIIITIVGILNL